MSPKASASWGVDVAALAGCAAGDVRAARGCVACRPCATRARTFEPGVVGRCPMRMRPGGIQQAVGWVFQLRALRGGGPRAARWRPPAMEERRRRLLDVAPDRIARAALAAYRETLREPPSHADRSRLDKQTPSRLLMASYPQMKDSHDEREALPASGWGAESECERDGLPVAPRSPWTEVPR